MLQYEDRSPGVSVPGSQTLAQETGLPPSCIRRGALEARLTGEVTPLQRIRTDLYGPRLVPGLGVVVALGTEAEG